jgi:hypothetical protein
MFNRPGPRLVDGLEFIAGLLHNRHDLIPEGACEEIPNTLGKGWEAPERPNTVCVFSCTD